MKLAKDKEEGLIFIRKILQNKETYADFCQYLVE